MAKIQVLDKQVAELVAAGEVVERPASVVKELMENSVDAGATAITVEIRGGGISYLRVTDNGCGIPADEVEVAFQRHATSKISSAEDLEAIGTLGFRGEALAAISAVSKVELMTKTASATTGCRAVLEGGTMTECYETGCRDGTTIIIRDLFYNTPARLKFLKKDVTEANAVAGIVERVALSHPEISVRFFRDGKEALYTPGNGKLFSAIYSVLGKDFASGLMEISYEREGVSVSGFVTKPFAAQASRAMQLFFLNGRSVKSRTAMAALEEAYRNTIATGRFPGCVLHIGMDLHLVDVNIHPTKTEVRFVNERPLFDAVYFAAKSALESGKTIPKLNLNQNSNPFTSEVLRTLPAKDQPLVSQEQPVSAPRTGAEPFAQGSAAKPVQPGVTPQLSFDKPAAPSFTSAALSKPAAVNINIVCDEEIPFKPKTQPATPVTPSAYPPEAPNARTSPEMPAPQEEKSLPEKLPEPEFRLIGEVFSSYVLIESEGQFHLIDKHAAHERILFERLAESTGEVHRQTLLMPIVVSLTAEERALALENLPLLEKAGFIAEDLGGSLILRELPAYLDAADAQTTLAEILARLSQGGSGSQTRRLDDIFHITACKAAIKAGSKSDPKELAELVRVVLTDPKIRYCPHGRPVMISMSKYELDKRFGRA